MEGNKVDEKKNLFFPSRLQSKLARKKKNPLARQSLYLLDKEGGR